jgi:hypothetical protein
VLSPRLAPAAALLRDDARVGGLMLYAPSGWGKSRLLGRSICHQDSRRGVGSVVLDVVGATVDNALDKLLYLPRSEQLAALSRIRYCNMAGEEVNGQRFAPAWPMLAPQRPAESLYETSQRLVDLIAKTDRALASASIQGLNRLVPLLTAAASVLRALELPISAAFDLLLSPEAWRARIQEAVQRRPEAAAAAGELQAFSGLPRPVREERAEPLRNKLSLLKFDPVSAAMFSAASPLIDWDEVADQGLQVYIDLRHELSDRARELKLFWVWNSLLEYIRGRGSSGRLHPPLSVVIDELSFFVRGTSLNIDVICEEFREVIQVRQRNANIWLTAATQEQAELPETMQRACSQMANQLYGGTSELETAQANARRWYPADPYRVKHWRSVWGSVAVSPGRYGSSMAGVLGQEPVFLPLEEQEHLASLRFRTLPKGSWLFAGSAGEGRLPTALRTVSTAALDPGLYVQTNPVARLRRHLMQRDGLPVTTARSLPQRGEQAGKEPEPLRRAAITRRSPRARA